MAVKGVFLTQTHFDHIYGILPLLERFPDCKVFMNEYGKQALTSAKLNMLRYHEMPIVYKVENVVLVHEGEEFCLIGNEPILKIHETPGHNPSYLTMVFGDMVFTGDSYIPTIGVNTLLPHADIAFARLSLESILIIADGETISLWPSNR